MVVVVEVEAREKGRKVKRKRRKGLGDREGNGKISAKGLESWGREFRSSKRRSGHMFYVSFGERSVGFESKYWYDGYDGGWAGEVTAYQISTGGDALFAFAGVGLWRFQLPFVA